MSFRRSKYRKIKISCSAERGLLEGANYAAFFSRLTFAHLALCAAAILLRPAAEIVRLGLTVLFAHRAFCAKLILLRAAGDKVCWRDEPFELTLPKAASAASMRWTCFCARSRSFLNCWTTPDRFAFAIDSPSPEMIAG